MSKPKTKKRFSLKTFIVAAVAVILFFCVAAGIGASFMYYRIRAYADDSRTPLPWKLGTIIEQDFGSHTIARADLRDYFELSGGITPEARNLLSAALNFRQVPAIDNYDIAYYNMLAARGLPGGESINIEGNIRQLNEWAKHVRDEIKRNEHIFHDNPKKFNNSLSYFKVLTMVCTIQEDYGIRYDASQIKKLSEFNSEDLRDSRKMFIHGVLEDRQGTCSNLPVLYVAIARRLGFPVYLVATKGHFFCRWEDKFERFNFDGSTSRGVNMHSDEHYKHWPLEMSENEIKANGYLRSMTPIEEVTIFLINRGEVLYAARETTQAQAVFAYAQCLIPTYPLYALRYKVAIENTVAAMRGKNFELIDSEERAEIAKAEEKTKSKLKIGE